MVGLLDAADFPSRVTAHLNEQRNEKTQEKTSRTVYVIAARES